MMLSYLEKNPLFSPYLYSLKRALVSDDDTLFDPLLDQPEVEDFSTLLKQSFANAKKRDNRIMHGKVVQIGSDAVLVDVGLKSEGLISIKEFMTPDKHLRIKEGDTVDVYLERMEDKHGQPILSREKAKQEEIWQYFEQAQEKQLPIEGVITSRVKSGFTVILNDPNIQSATPAFLPSSQVDINLSKTFPPCTTRRAVYDSENRSGSRECGCFASSGSQE